MEKIVVLFALFTCYPVQAQAIHEFSQTPNAGVRHLTVNADGSLISSVHEDDHILVWNVKSGALKQTIVPTGWVYKASFSADGNYLAFGNGRTSIWIWNIESNQLYDSISCDLLEPRALTFSPGEPLIAFAERKGVVKVWNIANRKEVSKTTMSPGCEGLSFSPDGNTLAIANGRKVLLWNIKSGQKQSLDNYNAKVVSVQYSPDGKNITVGCRDKKIRIYDTKANSLKHFISVNYPGETCLCNDVIQFNPAGSFLAYISPWSEIKITDISSWETIKEIDENQITFFTFLHDGTTLVYGLRNGQLKTVEL